MKIIVRQLLVLTEADLITWRRCHTDYNTQVWRCNLDGSEFELGYCLRVRAGDVVAWFPLQLGRAIRDQAYRKEVCSRQSETSRAVDAVENKLRQLLSPEVSP